MMVESYPCPFANITFGNGMAHGTIVTSHQEKDIPSLTKTPSAGMLAQIGGLMTDSTPPQKITTRIYENSWGKRHSPLTKLLAVILLVLLCYKLAEGLLFRTLCSEQDRNIPPNTEVIVSACKHPTAIGVPGGEVLFVREHRSGKMYLLALRTGEKRKVPDDPLFLDDGIFLSSELVWLEGSSVGSDNPNYRPHYILDLTDGQRYELLDLNGLPLKDGKFDPKYYAYFKSAEQVFIHNTGNRVIALSPNFRQNPERNVIYYKSPSNTETNYENGELLEKLMKDLEVAYQIVDLSLRYSDITSPTGAYIIRSDGIYHSETNTPVVTREYTGKRFIGDYFISWYYDESGVVIFKEGGGYLINFSESQGHYRIPTPILKLRLPAP